MKKIIAVLIVFCLTVSLFALEEVRGVQTRKIDDYHFEFKNDNNFSVSVEAELYYGERSAYGNQCININLKNVKSFNLAAGETYVWKTEWGCDVYVKYKAWKMEK